MKKIFGIVSVLLMIVCFTHEAKAYLINDGGGEIVKSEVSYETAPMVVALNPTAIDNVVIVSSVKNVVASVMNCMEVGGSIVSSDSADPDDDNFVAITKSRRTMLLHLLSLRKHKKYLASNDNYNSVTNDKDNFNSVTNGKIGNITANVGKFTETYIV